MKKNNKKNNKNMLNIYNGITTDENNILPSYINLNDPKYIEIDNLFYSGLIVVNYYREQTDIILKTLIETNINMNISIFYEKQDPYKIIKDLNEAELYAREDIESCYALGLMNGDNYGNFNPRSQLTRAEASLVVCRLIGAIDRAKTTMPTMKETLQYSPLPDNSNVGITGNVYPYEGATDINTGKVITRDPNTGVLGFGNGQTGNIYYGVDASDYDGNKYKIKDGATVVDRYDNIGFSDTYTQKHGYSFWTSEWVKISNYAYKQLPTPNASMVGTKADINGKVIAKNDTQTPAFWEVIPAFDVYIWSEI